MLIKSIVEKKMILMLIRNLENFHIILEIIFASFYLILKSLNKNSGFRFNIQTTLPF